jgi:hypothetical protein
LILFALIPLAIPIIMVTILYWNSIYFPFGEKVTLIHFDGERQVRPVRNSRGRKYAVSISSRSYLNEDGTTSGPSFVKTWEPVYKKRILPVILKD